MLLQLPIDVTIQNYPKEGCQCSPLVGKRYFRILVACLSHIRHPEVLQFAIVCHRVSPRLIHTDIYFLIRDIEKFLIGTIPIWLIRISEFLVSGRLIF